MTDDAAQIAHTPTDRITINRLSVVQLETMLDGLRERRLAARRKIEKAAKVKSEQANLSAYLRFEKLLKAVRKDEAKIDAAIEKLEKDVRKLQILTVEMGD